MKTQNYGWAAVAALLGIALPANAGDIAPGSLHIGGDLNQVCPLKHTDVQAEISGFLARVVVTQEFVNPTARAIEAVYKFPLPGDAAVDGMEMRIGSRIVTGTIKRREEAEKLFDDARRRGQTAALLNQERPNIFTQSVTNIGPGERVRIVIQYVETVKYEDNHYEWVFPMVVGPRYIPSSVPNGRDLQPRRTPQGTRAGHDINVRVTVDAGLPLKELASATHLVETIKGDPRHALVSLKNQQSIPNQDFILRYAVAGDKIDDAVITHHNGKDGFFTLILQPPARVQPNEVTPKEIVFVIDTSGSMMGFPLEKIKEVMRFTFDGLHPRDRFNVITFSGDHHVLFPGPVPATPDNITAAWEFVRHRQGRGGTEMLPAIRTALTSSGSKDHVRVVCFMTDGEVGNDLEILAEIQRNPQARVFAFGIGSSVNRFLLDGMARHGRGEVEYVGLSSEASSAAKRFYERVRTPLLTDVRVDVSGVDVSETYPARVPDVFSAKPVVVVGRYNKSGRGIVRVQGQAAGKPWSREIAVDFPQREAKHDVIASLWARRKIDSLMNRDLAGVQRGSLDTETREAIVQLGLNFRLMTQYTSFIAVEERIVNEGGKPRRIEVPVEMPAGVSYEGIEGKSASASGQMLRMAAPMAPPPARGDYGRHREMDRPAAAQVAEVRVADEAPGLNKLDPALQTMGPGQTVKVEIWLTASNPALLNQLRQLGFVLINAENGQRLIGNLPSAQLAAIARIEEVRLIKRAR
jgi:Ca-activated chloride channel family protein